MRARTVVGVAFAFALVPLGLVGAMRATREFELFDVPLYFLIQPQGQLFAHAVGEPAMGVWTVALACLVYGLVGAFIGDRVVHLGWKKLVVAALVGFLAWEVVLFLVAALLAVLGVISIT